MGLGIRSSPARLVWSIGCSLGAISGHLGRPDRFGPRARARAYSQKMDLETAKRLPEGGQWVLEEERNFARAPAPKGLVAFDVVLRFSAVSDLSRWIFSGA